MRSDAKSEVGCDRLRRNARLATLVALTMNMGATLFRMTVDECLAGVTREAARALGVIDEIGTFEPGKWADLAVWDIEQPAELVYRMGFKPPFMPASGEVSD